MPIGSLPVRIFFLLPAIMIAACQPQPPATRFRSTGETIAFGGGDGGVRAACVNCHGLKGEGDGRLAPRLAGLDAGYLHRQLDDYVAGRRDHAPMRTVAVRLTGDDRAKVSAYYAALPVPTGPVTGEANPTGDRLWRVGDPKRGLLPCAACHGVKGQGMGPGLPPLAGQPADYIATQLTLWKTGKRHNDALGQMIAISRRLTDREIAAVADHAAAFPAARPPAVPEASP